MTVYRCDWCGRFYSSALPEPSACANHIPEHNERLQAQIARFNAKLAVAVRPPEPVADDARPDLIERLREQARTDSLFLTGSTGLLGNREKLMLEAAEALTAERALRQQAEQEVAMLMRPWQTIDSAPENTVVLTKIHDAQGERNEQPLKRQGRLWWFADGSMYVYYTPTHWRALGLSLPADKEPNT